MSRLIFRPVIAGCDPTISIKVRIVTIKKPPLPSFHENPNVSGKRTYESRTGQSNIIIIITDWLYLVEISPVQ
jgi:hypothetical protein